MSILRIVRSVMVGISLTLAAGSASAVTVTAQGSNNYTIAFNPLTFTVTNPTSYGLASVVFKDFFASPLFGYGTYQGGTAEVSVNGGATQSVTGNSATGHYYGLNDVSGNDLIMTIYSGFNSTFGGVSVGDVITISALNYTFNTRALFIPSSGGPSSTYLVDNSFTRISTEGVANVAAVPLPAPVLMLGASLAGLVLFGRRRRNLAS